MLTGLKINVDVVTPSRGLFLTCMHGENIYRVIQLYTVQYLTCGVFKCKNPLLGEVAFSQG
jgi:hypothetical protein